MDELGEKLMMGFIGILLIAVVILLGYVFYLTFTPAGCDAQTLGIGLNHTWDLAGGCRIQLENGNWIPLNNYVVNKPQ